MSKSTSSNSSGGIGFLGLLTIVFIVLKLTGYINWSWIGVLAPIWMPTVIVVLVLFVAFIINKISLQRKRNQAY